MGTRTAYEPGTFCWIDLSTPDVEGAKRFYAGLFGWEIEDRPGPHGTYSMARSGGDPAGAHLCLWQANEHVGAGRVNERGCLTWNELGTPDAETAGRFYAELFGWGLEPMDTAGGPAYTIIKVGERSNGGMRELSPHEREGGVPPAWMPYFAADSVDASIARAGELGGRVLAGPIDLPNGGRIAAMADPQGAAFALSGGLPLDD